MKFLSDAQIERLALLGEELGEAQQAVCKILRFGFESYNPYTMNRSSNREQLEKELGHVDNSIRILVRSGDISQNQILINSDVKSLEISKYLRCQSTENNEISQTPSSIAKPRSLEHVIAVLEVLIETKSNPPAFIFQDALFHLKQQKKKIEKVDKTKD